jgi:hypothetical protein
VGSPGQRDLKEKMGVVALLIILAGLPFLLLAPVELGAVRAAGVGLAWWYGGVMGELLALALAILKVPRAR